MRAREIPIQTRSTSGNFYSYKNKKIVKYESQLEKKCFLLLEFNKSVQSYIEQPLKVKKYVPDVLAHRRNDKDLLIEVKYHNEVEQMDEKLKRKINIVQNYCDKNNLEFKIFTEQDIKDPYFSNISLIYNYSGVIISKSEKDKIIDFFLRYDEISLKELISHNINAVFIYKMIFDGILEVNLFKKLTANTPIRISYDRD